MKKLNWITVIVTVLVVLVVFLAGASLLGGGRFGEVNRFGYHMGPGMMGGWGFSPFGWLGMLFMWLFPAALLVLVVLGIIYLARVVSGNKAPTAPPPAVPERICPNCSRSVQADWQHCAYCGQDLTT